MSGERGPTTEELRARVLAQLAEIEQRGRELDGAMREAFHETSPPPVGRWERGFSQQVQQGWERGSEGRTFYDPARPPLDSEGAERHAP